MIYWDTSALLKLYAEETDSTAYRQELIRQTRRLVVSFLHHTELFYALRMKEERGEIQSGGARKAAARFFQDIRNGHYHVQALDSDVRGRACEVLAECLQSSPPVPLRTLDGLHLSAASVSGCDTVVTADVRMGNAARSIGLGVVQF